MPTFTLPTLPDLSPATPVLWRGRVWTGVEDAPLNDGAVLTRAGRIEAVGPATQLAALEDAVTVQTDGTILPGLIDLHVHARPRYLPWFVAAGVTTVRDACN